MRQKWDACIDCGRVKVNKQRYNPRCNSCAQKEAQNRPDVKAKMSASLTVAMNRPDVKEKCSKAQKELWGDPEVKEARSSVIRDVLNQGHIKDKMRAKNRETANCPDIKEKRIASLKRTVNNPEYTAKHSARARAAANRPEVREKKSAAMKELTIRPDIRIARSLQRGGDGDIARIDRMKLRIAEYRSSHLRAWSLAVRERDSYICQHCGESDRRRLHAHHIKPRAMFPDLAFEIDNGLTLCNSCHLKEHRKMKKECAGP